MKVKMKVWNQFFTIKKFLCDFVCDFVYFCVVYELEIRINSFM